MLLGRISRSLSIGILLLLLTLVSDRAEQLFAQSTPLDGYTLFSPNNSRTTKLIDMSGTVVHSWSHSRTGGYSCYLLPNGNLLRPSVTSTSSISGAASAGLIQQFDWNGNLVWEFDYASSSYVTHHDLEPMPNGNVLAIAWEVKSSSEASSNGRQNAREMWPDHIIEVQPNGMGGASIVWEWHVWDHLIQDVYPSRANYGVVKDHPELIDINLASSSGGPGGGYDWLHINGISYNPDRDEIAITSHYLNEVFIIDHSTTTAQAAGHTGGTRGKGGDILYRWGYAQNYDISGSDYLDVTHCPYWIPQGCPGAGNMLMFDNNTHSHASEIVEIVLPRDASGNYLRQSGAAFGPTSPTWTYSNGSSFYSNHLGGCQRLTNGNTLISESTSGYLFEVDAQGSKVWDYNVGSQTARSLRYARSYTGVSALVGTDLDVTISAPEINIDWDTDSYDPMPFTVTVTVTNTGASTADNVYVTLSFDQQSSLGFASPDSPTTARKGLSPLSLAKGSSNTVTYTVEHPVVDQNTQATISALVEADNANNAQDDHTMDIPGLLASTFNFMLSAATPLQFCEGGLVQIDAPSGYASYRWSNGDTTRSIIVSTGGSYHCTVFDAGMKGLSDTVVVDIFPAPQPTIAVTGSMIHCAGDSVMLDAGDGYATYLWSTSETTRSIIVHDAGDYYVTVSDLNGCTGVSDTVRVQKLPAPHPTIAVTGSMTYCEGDSVLLDAGDGYASYLWNTSETTKTITVKDAGEYFVTVSDMNGCFGTSDTVSVQVLPAPQPMIAVTGSTILCAGDSVLLDAGDGYASYLWNTSETTRTITVQDAGEYSVAVSDVNGCSGTSDTVTVQVVSALEPRVTLIGSPAICEGDSVILDAGAGYASYLWSTQDTTQTITVFGAGEYFVSVSSGAGCTGRSDTVTTSVLPRPNASITVTGNLAFCAGESVVLDAGADYTKYLWNTKDSSQSITVHDAGEYFATVWGSTGCPGSSDTVTVTMWPSPVPVIRVTGSIPLCPGDSVVLNVDKEYSSYSWNTQAITRSIVVDTPGEYVVTVTDDNGCTGLSDRLTVTMAQPTKPLITRMMETLSATNAAAWQWYRNGQPLTGETAQTLQLQETGSYTVEIVDENGCTVMSDPFQVDVLAVESADALVSNFDLYPNPSNGSFTVTLRTRSPQDIVLTVTDMLGRQLYHQETGTVMSFTEKIDLSLYPSGPYFIRVALAEKIITRLITKN